MVNLILVRRQGNTKKNIIQVELLRKKQDWIDFRGVIPFTINENRLVIQSLNMWKTMRQKRCLDNLLME